MSQLIKILVYSEISGHLFNKTTLLCGIAKVYTMTLIRLLHCSMGQHCLGHFMTLLIRAPHC